MIDLRSDTVTLPSDEMRRAMFTAEVGDDVFGEDPSVNRLQEFVADLLGKEAALFVPSGHMGNQLALKAQTEPGDEVILADNSHILHYESAAASALSGLQLAPVPTTRRGYPLASEIEEYVRAGAYWQPRSRIIALENTVNSASGVIFPQDEILDIAAIAASHGLRLHLDGARLWNAAAALDVPVKSLAAPFDSVTVCLSKGLGAPVGSVLASDTGTIKKAHRYRKMFGGGMRQVGFMAAAGQHAVEHNFSRLTEDHANARTLADAIASMDAFSIDGESVQTNIVIFRTETASPEKIIDRLADDSVRMIKFGPREIRAITHLDVLRSDIDRVVSVLGSFA